MADPGSGNPSRALHIGLWVAQVLLALAFGMAGSMKSVTPIEELSKSLPWVSQDLALLVRFIGVSEFAGALGLILPAATRIRPKLTPIAAGGLVLVMALAAVFHLTRGEYGAIGVNATLGALAAFIAWGRTRRAPIEPR